LFLGYLFHVAMAYLAAFLLIIFAVFIGSVASLLDAEPSEHGKIVLGAVFFLLLFLAGTLPQSFFTAGAYGAAAACVFRGKSTIGSFFSEGFRNLWKMFGQQVLLVLFLMVALLLVIFPFGLLVRTEEPPTSSYSCSSSSLQDICGCPFTPRFFWSWNGREYGIQSSSRFG